MKILKALWHGGVALLTAIFFLWFWAALGVGLAFLVIKWPLTAALIFSGLALWLGWEARWVDEA